jgi:CRP/FNR family transcriptional regulator, nitrogen oxide reductase regulator
MGIKLYPPQINLTLLLQTPLFQGLTEAELANITRQSHLQSLAAGEFFFLQNDLVDSIYILIQGRVKLTQSDSNGEQVLLRSIGPYELFGAVALTEIKNYMVTAQASEDSQAIYWKRSEIKPFVQQYPVLAMNGIQIMANHAQEVQERFKQLATQNVERRLANTLLRLASQTGRKIEEGVLIDMPLTRQDLAEMSGMTLFTVSRLLKQWQEQQLVISKRERVIIRYPHGLVCIAEDIPLE